MLTRKSSVSRISLPPIRCTFERILKPNTQGMLSTIISTTLISMAFLRSIPKLSIKDPTIFSKTAVTVEKLAKVIKRKNSVPQILPPLMSANTLGSVIKIKDGPSSGLILKLKQAGKIMSPDISATKVSSALIRSDSPIKVWFFDM